MRYKFIILLLVLSTHLSAEEIHQRVSFQTTDLAFSKLQGYDIVKLKNAGALSEVSSPMLPQVIRSVLLPPDADVVRVEVMSYKREELPGKYNIFPVQHPKPFSVDLKTPFAEPNEKIYSSTQLFPGELIKYSHTGSKAGYRITSLLIYPVQYIPAEKKLYLYSEISFKIVYKKGKYPVKYKTEHQRIVFGEAVKSLVTNPEDIEKWSPPVGINFSPLLSPDAFEYVIITDSTTYGSYFQPLIDWKTKKGIPARIVDIAWILSNYIGDDTQDKIRQFIADAEAAWGTLWFLLGGDSDIIPERICWIFSTGYGDWYDNIPCDLYYADLDGSWNADGDDVYGEVADDVDMYTDVFVGRASINTIAECNTFVNKTLWYERNPNLSYLEKMLLPAELLFSPDYWGDFVCDSIANQDPASFYDCKLYESLGNLSDATVLDSIGAGYHFIHHAAHGDVTLISTGYSSISNSELDALTNTDLYGIYTAISCLSGAFDEDCYAEHWMNNPNGGGVAACLNSRYGWGTLDYPGRSEWLDIEFFDQLFNDGFYQIGHTLANAKDYYIPYTGADDVVRWCLYALILFGDPELPMWTAVPESLVVFHDPVIPVGASSFQVTVTTAKAAVESAYVCVLKDNEVYERDYTDANGNAILNLSPSPTSLGTLFVTVTKHNFKSYEGAALAISPEGPYLVYDSYIVDDDTLGASWGNSDSLVDAGESIELPITIHNVGQDIAYSVSTVLQSTDSFVTITDSMEDYGDILPDSYVACFEDFDFDIAWQCPNNHNIMFQLVMNDINDSTWISTFFVPVPTPTIEFNSCTIDDDSTGESLGNGDGIANPGETVELPVTLKNTGPEVAYGVSAILSTGDPYITLIDSVEDFGDIAAGDIGNSWDDFVFYVNSSCPKDHWVTCYLDIVDSDSASKNWADSFTVHVWAPGDIMIVAKDADYTTYYTDALDSLDYTYDVYNSVADTSVMKAYNIIIWLTGDLWGGTVTSTEQTALAWYLDSGNNLFITGQDIGYDLVSNGSGPTFYANYLHANYVSDDANIYTLYGVSGDEIGDGLTIGISGGDGASNQNWPSKISPLTGADSVFRYSGSGYGAVKYEGIYRMTYFAFGYEAINSFNNRVTVMQRVLNWFKRGPLISDVSVTPELADVNSEVVINATITDPDGILQATAEIENPDEVVQDSIILYDDGAHNDSLPSDDIYGNTWTTLLTPMDYLVDIIAEDNNSYISVLNNGASFTTIQPPDIVVTPESLGTSLVCDDTARQILTLKNIGGDTLIFNICESGSPSGRIKIAPTKHIRPISFANPKVESVTPNTHKILHLERKANVAEPMISREGYPFAQVIFFDDMESGTGGWTTVDYSGGGDLWHQTTSHLYVAPAYHSPTHSWWCGIDGNGTYNNGFKITNALISPDINLTGGYDSVTFSFWEYYETESGYDLVNVDISTDGGTSWNSLRSGATGSSSGWQERSFDISTYVGNNIKIRFYFDTQDAIENNYYGGFIDDVRISAPGFDWLSEEPVSGSVPPGDSIDIIVSYDATGLMPDSTYFGWLQVNSNDFDEPVVSIPVTLTTLLTSGNVGPIAILSPPETVYVDSLYVPQAYVTNFGADTVHSFDVTCTIDTAGAKVYMNTKVISNLAGGDTVLATFVEWIVPDARKDYLVKAFTQFLNDTVPSNDTLEITVSEYNDAPVVFGLPDTGFREDESLVIDLDVYAYDTDDIDSVLTWFCLIYESKHSKTVASFRSRNNKKTEQTKSTKKPLDNYPSPVAETKDGPIYVAIDSITHIATIVADSNWYGSRNIIFTVLDPWGLSSFDTMQITVNPVNDSPVIDSFIPEESPCLTYVDSILCLCIYAHDLEDTLLAYEWAVNGIVDTASGPIYTYLSPEVTTDTVQVIISDSYAAQDSMQWIVIVTDIGIEEELPALPKIFALEQNSPNPFVSKTIIKYQVAGLSLKTEAPRVKGSDVSVPNSTVSLKIYDITGSIVRTLVDEPQDPGYYSVAWDGHDSDGKKVPTGIYFYRLKVGSFVKIRKAILIR